MRKLFLSIVLFTSLCFNANAKIGFAPEMGLNISNLSFSNVSFSNAANVTGYVKAGLRLGLNFDRQLNEDLSLQFGTFFSQLGGRMNANVVFVGPVMVPISLYYAQVPITCVYHRTLGPGTMLFSAGLYAGYALGMTATPADTGFHPDNLNLGSDSKSLIQSLDYGLHVSAGYQLHQGFFAKLNYDLGLANLAAQNNATIHNRAFYFSIGWFYRSTKVKVENKAY